MPWTVYCHIHIESGRRYVGLTSQTVKKRWSEHVSKARNSKGGRWHFPNAIRKYGPQAFKPEILQVCESLKEGNAAEERWIEELGTRDPKKGFNLVKGGQHMPHPIQKSPWDDPKYRAKASANSKAMWNDPGYRNKASVNSKERWKNPGLRARMSANHNLSGIRRRETLQKIKIIQSSLDYRARLSASVKIAASRPEVREKLSIAGRGRILSADVRANLSRIHSGKKLSQETRDKISTALMGHTMGEETRKKLSEARKGKVTSPETRAKLSRSNSGRLHTAESKLKMSMIQRRKAFERAMRKEVEAA